MVAHVTPGIILTNTAASHVVTMVPSDNVPLLIALGKDPLFQKKTRADTLYGLVDLMDEARRAGGGCIQSAPPILYLHGEKDQVIPARAAEAAIHDLGGQIARARISQRLSHAAARPGRRPRAGRCRRLGSARSACERERKPSRSGVITSKRLRSEDDRPKKHDLRDGFPCHITNTNSRDGRRRGQSQCGHHDAAWSARPDPRAGRQTQGQRRALDEGKPSFTDGAGKAAGAAFLPCPAP